MFSSSNTYLLSYWFYENNSNLNVVLAIHYFPPVYELK